MSDQLAIHCRGLTKRFGNHVAVNRLDLDIAKASIYGFLGPNGSGKSTSIQMLCGLLTPNEGEVTVLGYRIPQQAENLKRRMGYMTQKFSLYEDLTVFENLLFMADIFSIRGVHKKQRLDYLIEQYKLTDKKHQLTGSLSGGQKQRLSLACATLHQPDLLLLDEPTSAVDPQNRRDFWESLFDLVEEGTTILVSTHYMDEAERCHRLAILDRGIKVADGVPAELMANVNANVVEVITDVPRNAKALLLQHNEIHSVAQIGNALRVLVDKQLDNPQDCVEQILQTAQMTAQVRRIRANLEDVFVAATQANHPHGSAP